MSKTFSYLICYDIGDPKLLRKVAGFLENEGLRLQKSVFLVRCAQHREKQIRQKLAAMIGTDHHLIVLPVCGRCFGQAVFLGKAPEPCWVAD